MGYPVSVPSREKHDDPKVVKMTTTLDKATMTERQKKKIPPEGMDTILKGILVAEKPQAIKNEIIQKIVQQASQRQDDAVVSGVLNTCISQILESDNEFICSSCKNVYINYAKFNQATLFALWDNNLLNQLFDCKFRNGANGVWLIHQSFKLLLSSPNYDKLCKLVEIRSIAFVRENLAVDTVAAFCAFLTDCKACIPKGEYTTNFCVSLIHAVSTFSAPHNPKQMRSYVSDVTLVVGKFLEHIWYHTDAECLNQCLKTIFKVISLVSDGLEPSNALGGIVQYIPTEMIATVTQTTASDSSIPDASMTSALLRMIDWLNWPLAKNIDHWIIAFLQQLAHVHKYTILIDVTESRVEKVYATLDYPLVRESALAVLAHMLLSFQHSPQAFHKIVGSVPKLIKSLTFNNKTSKEQEFRAAEDRRFAAELAELMHCLMQLHPGFPDLYDPILAAIKDLPQPSEEKIRMHLNRSKWVSSSSSVSSVPQLARRSETNKTGLVNLGNTCYLNSVIQALFMCDNFRRSILGAPPSLSQPLLKSLQMLFAFLSHTQRAAYAPHDFLKSGRPDWFLPGFQQDCSEFMRWLLDQLHEQERSAWRKGSITTNMAPAVTHKVGQAFGKTDPSEAEKDSIPTLMQRTFGGKVQTTCTCQKCGNESSRVDMFTDLSLAFPDKPEAKNSKWGIGATLVGGDSKNSDKNTGTLKTGSPLPLEEMLQYYLTPEQLTGDNKYFCERCQSLQDGEKQLKILEAPEYLMLTLLRFAYNPKTQTRTKIFTDVRYPKALRIPVHVLNPSPVKKKFGKAPGPQVVPANYGLSTVIVHSGASSECGHYYSYARHSLPVTEREQPKYDLDYLQEKWYLFNDSRVTYSSYDSFSNVTKRFSKDTAYVLIYRRIWSEDIHSSTVQRRVSIQTETVDPPLNPRLRDAVDKDNKLFIQEQELEGRRRAMQKRSTPDPSPSSWYNWHDSDDQGGPPGSCGGGGGMGGHDTSGNKFIF